MHGSLFCRCSQNYLLVQKGLCSYLIVGLVSMPVSQCKQKIQGVLNPICCLPATACEYVNLTLTYIMNIRKKWASERHTRVSERNKLKPVDVVWTSARSSKLCYSLTAKLAKIQHWFCQKAAHLPLSKALKRVSCDIFRKI